MYWVFIAIKLQKPAKDRGVIAASLPPARMTSASPLRIRRSASPKACVAVAQAVGVGGCERGAAVGLREVDCVWEGVTDTLVDCVAEAG